MTLNRHTRLAPGKPLARKKARKLPSYPPAAALTERAAWSHQWTRCMLCRRQRPLDCHEIVTRAKTKHWCCKPNFLACCRLCHERVLVWMNVEIQCAFKAIEDPIEHDLNTINELRSRGSLLLGRKPNAITYEEVKNWMEVIQTIRGDA